MTIHNINLNRGVTTNQFSSPACQVSWLGKIDYQPAFDLQKRIWQNILDNDSIDQLLLLEHSPTLTIGISGKLVNLLVTKEELERRGVSFYFTDRGGDITYHGPGQLVAYPIINLATHGKDIHQYIYNLQEVVIRTLADFSIKARRDASYVGVWVEKEKIAAIGVAVHKWVTTHGFALNVNTDLDYFKLINPCGIRDKGVTSMTRLLDREVPMIEISDRVAQHFGDVFDTQIEWVSNNGDDLQ